MVRKEIVNYVQKGMKRGFSTGYIKEVMIRHGHSSLNVDLAINAAVKRETDKGRIIKYSLLGSVLVLILALMFFGSVGNEGDTPTSAVIVELEQQKETEPAEKTADDYMKQIDQLNSKLDQDQRIIQSQIEQLKDKDLSAEEKEIIIRQNIEKLEELNDKIDKERAEMRQLLLELLNEILTR